MPSLNDASVSAEARKALSYGLSHLILLTLLFAAVVGGVYLYDSKRTDQAESKAQLSQATAQVADAQNTKLQAQTAQQIQLLAQQNASLQAQVAALAAAITQRDSALATQIAAAKSLPPPALATQWGVSAQEPAPSIDQQGNFLAPLPLAQKSYEALLAVPVLQEDNKDLQAASVDQKQQIANGQAALGVETKAHLGDNAACAADKKALADEVAAVKAKARKSKLKWGLGGFVTGAVTVLAHFI